MGIPVHSWSPDLEDSLPVLGTVWRALGSMGTPLNIVVASTFPCQRLLSCQTRLWKALGGVGVGGLAGAAGSIPWRWPGQAGRCEGRWAPLGVCGAGLLLRDGAHVPCHRPVALLLD